MSTDCTSGFRGGGRRGRAPPPFEIPKRVFKEGQRGRTPPAPPPLLKFQRGSSNGTAAAPPPFHKSWIRPWIELNYVGNQTVKLITRVTTHNDTPSTVYSNCTLTTGIHLHIFYSHQHERDCLPVVGFLLVSFIK